MLTPFAAPQNAGCVPIERLAFFILDTGLNMSRTKCDAGHTIAELRIKPSKLTTQLTRILLKITGYFFVISYSYNFFGNIIGIYSNRRLR